MSAKDLIEASAGRMTILGNIPPRDVLGSGTPDDVKREVKKLLDETPDKSRLMLSVGGGMPPGVTTENIKAFIDAARI
jgi:uroporphyrinogen decarboxylase